MLKKYDIVRKKCGYWGDSMEDPRFDPSELFMIQGTYCDLYGGTRQSDDYSIVSLSTGGSSSWWHDWNLEFVRHGTEEELLNALNIYNTMVKQNQDIDYIKNNWPNVSEIAFLKLFKEIRYDSAFNHNGEYYALYCDMEALFPLFDSIFKNDREKMYDGLKVFKPEFRDEYTRAAEQLFNKIDNIK